MAKSDQGLSRATRDAIALRRMDLKESAIKVGGNAILLLGIAVCIFASTYPARALAGQTTVFDFSVSVAFTVVLSGVSATLGTLLKIRNSRIKDLEEANRKLGHVGTIYQRRLRKAGVSDVVKDDDVE